MADQSAGFITFTDSEVKSGYLVQQPAWYRLKILGVRKMISQKGDSDNYFVEILGRSGEMTDVEFTKMFNTSKGFKVNIVRYFVACNGGNDLQPGKQYGFDDTVGVELEGYVTRGADKNGNPINDVGDWRPIQQEQA
jgi:hypothetical protein